MPKLSVAVPHGLSKEEATERLQNRFSQLREKHGDQVHDFQSQWEGDRLQCSFSTLGVKVRAAVTVEPAQVTIDTELPMLAMMFKGSIEQQIRSELGEVLA
jgi:putative polyhydroxyalkanoate system protein